jgi:DNA repair exonuclease SbcCD ATPase subunit
MAITIKNVTIKNFLSVGANSQSVDLSQNGLTLILGENLDLGGNGNRNGVGKSTLISAICYALYGQALVNIKKDNLINSINKKNMVVAIEFDKNGTTYKIERGRKPNFFKYVVNDQCVNESSSDESQGENKDTQAELDKVIGLSHTMFKHIVAMNTYTEPFLNMGAGKQRELIEELLGITLLSQKAENLRKLIATTKTKIEQEEFKVATIKKSNERILNTIQDIENKILRWNAQQESKIDELISNIDHLEQLDVDTEIENHNVNAVFRETAITLRNLKSQLSTKSSHLLQLKNEQINLVTQYAQIQEHSCAMCGQTIHDEKQTILLDSLGDKITTIDDKISILEKETTAIQDEIDDIEPLFLQLSKADTLYSSIEEAYNHKNKIVQLETDLLRVSNDTNPYIEQLGTLNNTLQEINFDELNTLSGLKDHQEFLLKLLISKDSFIRKKIIDQNLAYLNNRLQEYLTTLNLAHQVKFSNDLSVEIMHMGQDFDFDQLSRGERTRVIMGLSWAFRDIWENMNTPINFFAIDELLDNGLDSSGVEKALEVLKSFGRDRNKNVLLISHREELVSRVNNILTVIKEDGFTRFDYNYEA